MPAEQPGQFVVSRDGRIQDALTSIVRIALEPIPLAEQLRQTLALIVALPWLAVESKGCIFLADEGRGELVMTAQAGLPEAVASGCARVPYGRCLCGRAIAEAHAIVTHEPDSQQESTCPGIQAHGHYCVPILYRGHRVGLLNLYVPVGHVQRPEELQFLGAVADVLAGAIERKRVEESLRESEERFELAVRGTDAGIWDWDLRNNQVYFSPRWKSMLGFGEDEIQDHFAEWESRLHPDDRERALDTIRDYLDDRTAEYELEHRLRHRDGTYRWILARGAKVRDAQGRPYRMVGSHLDITERKRVEYKLREREAGLIAARDIQAYLMPRAPLQAEGILIHGASFAADHAQGDSFDYFPLADGSIIVAIADVSGHGIDAALLMASAHARLRCYAELPIGIETMLARTNAGLAEHTESDRYITMLLLRIDPVRRTMVYCNAGHPPGYLLDAHGRVKAILESTSLPLAIMADETFEVCGPLPLEQGDRILLFTDGVFEARSPAGEAFGIKRVLQLVGERCDRTNPSILGALRAAVHEFTGAYELPDDVTIVLVQIGAAQEPR
jgi:PAS domain S-box-containing protein